MHLLEARNRSRIHSPVVRPRRMRRESEAEARVDESTERLRNEGYLSIRIKASIIVRSKL